MRLVHLEMRIDFAEQVYEYSLEQKIYKAITGRMPKEAEERPEQKVVLRFAKNKLAVHWDTESFGAILEQVQNVDNFIEIVIPLLNRINAVAPIGKLSHKILITHWLLPTPNYDFSALEQKYKETMIAQKPICEGTSDSSVILDISTSDGILHHQSGAMKIKQLVDEYLLFKLDNISKVFLFLWASIEEEKVVKYSSEEIQNYLLRSFNHCKSHSEAFERIWEEVL